MTVQAFTTTEVLSSLLNAATLYQEKAIFSRVSGLVTAALTIAVEAEKQGDAAVIAKADGYLAATMETIKSLATSGDERDALFLTLSAAQGLLTGEANIQQSGAFIAIITVELLAGKSDVQILTPVAKLG